MPATQGPCRPVGVTLSLLEGTAIIIVTTIVTIIRSPATAAAASLGCPSLLLLVLDLVLLLGTGLLVHHIQTQTSAALLRL